MSTSPVGRVAAALVAVEGLGLVALVLWQIAAIAAGDTEVLQTSIALIVLTVAGAAAVIAFAVAVWRDQSWGRSGGIVTQLLILAVSLGAATGEYAHPLTALAIAAPALLALVLLVLAVRESAARDRAEPVE
jgi:hypothetical protein